MQVASLGLCKELFELSGWNDTFFAHGKTRGVFRLADTVLSRENHLLEEIIAPAYDLGYLLGKLTNEDMADLTLISLKGGTFWQCSINGVWTCHAANPTDAAALLAIELFKQGVLK